MPKTDLRSYSTSLGHVAVYHAWHHLWYVCDLHVRQRFTGIRCEPDKRTRHITYSGALTQYVLYCAGLDGVDARSTDVVEPGTVPFAKGPYSPHDPWRSER